MQQFCQTKMLSKHPSRGFEKCQSYKLRMPMLCLTPVFGHCLLLENISIKKPPKLRERCPLKNVMHTRVTKAEVFESRLNLL